MPMTWKVAVAGCTGYAGGEVLRLLASHPQVEIGAVTAHSNTGVELGQLQPHLTSLADRMVDDTTVEALSGHDVVILALPHGESAKFAQQLDPQVLVIDCGADFRLSDPNDWQKFYGSDHAGTWPYGLPELPGQRQVLAETTRIAGPGCYPTAVTLALMPALLAGFIDAHNTVVVAASGTSGAGKSLQTHLLASEIMGSATAYAVGGSHRHIPEILQNLRSLGANQPTLSFTPLLVPMARGILATCTVPVLRTTSVDEVYEVYQDHYADELFVHLLPPGKWPATASVLGSNMVHVQVSIDRQTGWLIAVSAIDNLTKGTAGGVVQSMNIALGIDETTGLSKDGVAP